MVSSEGACAAHYTYGRFRDAQAVIPCAVSRLPTLSPLAGGGRTEARRSRFLGARGRRKALRADMKKNHIRPLDIRHGRIDMGHGAGGKAAAQLIEELFLAEFDNDYLRQGDDGAVLELPGFDPALGRIVMATDGHVVSPLFFPGGDVGCLSVHGTVNDVAMSGATPLYLSASFIIEEGFPLVDLQRIVRSMAAAAREAGVPIVAGDTKVVEQGKGDGVFICTTGVGVLAPGVHISGRNARPGDEVLLSGSIGDHGVAVLQAETDTCAAVSS